MMKRLSDVAERKRRIIEILKETNCNIALACDRVGVTRSAYYNYVKSDQDFRAVVKELYERRTDHVESKLMDLIDAGVPPAIFFYLKCQAKDRGYVEKQEVEHTGQVKHMHKISANLEKLDDTEIKRIEEILGGAAQSGQKLIENKNDGDE